MIMDSIEGRVAAGVEFLNDNGPAEWWDRVDVFTLDVEKGDHCVLGQVFAAHADETGSPDGYMYALHEFWFWEQYESVPKLGFSCAEYGEYPALTQAWRAAILDIRALVNA
jgi:hypothetical protein